MDHCKFRRDLLRDRNIEAMSFPVPVCHCMCVSANAVAEGANRITSGMAKAVADVNGENQV